MIAPRPRSILITGASSGIGAALAAVHAAPGIHLTLGGRDAARLAATASVCRAAGAIVRAAAIDVTDHQAMAAWITTTDQVQPLDLVIANAGVSGRGGDAGLSGGETAAARGRWILAVNVTGTFNTVEPALAPMVRRGRGQIALMSSLASFRGMPSAPAYAASKAAVRSYGEGLAARLRRHGVQVSVICPGFVATPLTRGNPFPMPGLVSAERAALIIKAGLERGRRQIAFPWHAHLAIRLLAALPASVADAWLARLPSKE
jgi:short-subunit dehydrogenase